MPKQSYPPFVLPSISTLYLCFLVVFCLLSLFIPVPPWILDIVKVLNFSWALTIMFIALYAHRLSTVASLPSTLILSIFLRLGLSLYTFREFWRNGVWWNGIWNEKAKTVAAWADPLTSAFLHFFTGGHLVFGALFYTVVALIALLTPFLAYWVAVNKDPKTDRSLRIVDRKYHHGLTSPEEALEECQAIMDDAQVQSSLRGTALVLGVEALLGLLAVLGLSAFSITFNADNVAFKPISLLFSQNQLILSKDILPFVLLITNEVIVRSIPILLIGLGLGVLLTRQDTQPRGLGDQILNNMTQHPYSLLFTSMTVMLIGFAGLFMGLPWSAFFLIALTMMGIAFAVFLAHDVQQQLGCFDAVKEKTEALINGKAWTPQSLQVPAIVLEIDETLSQRYQTGTTALGVEDNDTLSQVGRKIKAEPGITNKAGQSTVYLNPLDLTLLQLRKQMVSDYGFLTEAIQVQVNSKLGAGCYQLLLQGKQLLSGHLVDAEPEQASRSSLEEMADRIRDTLFENADLVLNHQLVLEYIEQVREQDPQLASQLIPDVIQVWDIQNILVALLKDKISVKNIRFIFERIANLARKSSDTDTLILALKTELPLMNDSSILADEEPYGC
jgi:flagellar biosynthesis protein FlhA